MMYSVVYNYYTVVVSVKTLQFVSIVTACTTVILLCRRVCSNSKQHCACGAVLSASSVASRHYTSAVQILQHCET
jgi:hypothetical protein